jgi:hypothetical protein
MLGDVAVRHPDARMRDVEKKVDSLASGHKDRVLPRQVGFSRAVSCQNQEAARAVYVKRMVHRVVGIHFVDQAKLDAIADAESPSIAAPSEPVCRSISFHRMLLGFVIRFTSTMSSSHSMPAG